MTKEEIIKFKEAIELFNRIDWVSFINTFADMEKQNKFLIERENKLQLIENMFKNEPIDLKELSKLVRGE